MTAKTRIVQIGNSRGIRVPKALLDQARLPIDVEVVAEPGCLVVRAARRPRAGWADAARLSRERNEDRLDSAAAPTRFERGEWEWR